MALTIESFNELAQLSDESWAFGADEAVPGDAFDFSFDEEGCLVSYWVTVNVRTGSKELVHTSKGKAALNAYMENTEFMASDPISQRDNWDYTAIK